MYKIVCTIKDYVNGFLYVQNEVVLRISGSKAENGAMIDPYRYC